jgi:hypothetical protein
MGMILVSCRGQKLLLETRTNAFDIDPEATREYADGYDADIEAESFYGESDRREDVSRKSANVRKIASPAVEFYVNKRLQDMEYFPKLSGR